MPAYARSQIVPPDEVGVYHCIARCVRRAFLCGVDPLTKHDYEHRKEWIRERLELLASVFAIDICVADPARQVFVTSRLDRSTASGGESRGDPDPARRFWSDWESSATAGSRQCGNSVAGSRQPSADPMRWRPWLHAGARPGSKAAMPPPWPFDSRPFGHRASPTDGWSARIAS